MAVRSEECPIRVSSLDPANVVLDLLLLGRGEWGAGVGDVAAVGDLAGFAGQRLVRPVGGPDHGAHRAVEPPESDVRVKRCTGPARRAVPA